MQLSKSITIMASGLFLLSCTKPMVQPWERDLLAQDQMQLVPDPVEDFFDNHIFYTREGSAGGKGVGGGGCGCN